MYSGFKRELFGYLLEYTAALIDALVEARESDPYATALNSLVADHNSGPFNDFRVGSCHLGVKSSIKCDFSCWGTSQRDSDRSPP